MAKLTDAELEALARSDGAPSWAQVWDVRKYELLFPDQDAAEWLASQNPYSPSMAPWWAALAEAVGRQERLSADEWRRRAPDAFPGVATDVVV